MSEGMKNATNAEELLRNMSRRLARLERAQANSARASKVETHDKYIDQLLNGGLPDLAIVNKITAADVESERLRLNSGSDASLSSTDHAFQIGATDGFNLIIDQNEIMARHNGAAAAMYIQTDGGGLGLNGADWVKVPEPTASDHATTKGYVDQEVLLAGGGASAWWPSETQTINFSRDVSTLKSHITLCWSDYNPGEGAQNYHWFVETISKSWILANSGVGSSHLIPLGSADAGVCTKYLYIHSNRIVGASTNDDSPQTDAALRAVYGY